MKKFPLTVAVPTYHMPDGISLFVRLMESLWKQTFQNFEIVVTDNSDDDEIEKVCAYYKTGISYYKNPIKGMAQNTNEAIRKSKGEWIKIIYMDDFLDHEESLQNIMDNVDGYWLVSGCRHTITGEEFFNNHHPKYSDDIHTGNNTIGSPSVLTIKNENPLLFDENLGWLLDCDYYKRMYSRYGEPTILKDINVVIGLHDGQVTNNLADSIKAGEYQYLIQKHA